MALPVQSSMPFETSIPSNRRHIVLTHLCYDNDGMVTGMGPAHYIILEDLPDKYDIYSAIVYAEDGIILSCAPVINEDKLIFFGVPLYDPYPVRVTVAFNPRGYVVPSTSQREAVKVIDTVVKKSTNHNHNPGLTPVTYEEDSLPPKEGSVRYNLNKEEQEVWVNSSWITITNLAPEEPYLPRVPNPVEKSPEQIEQELFKSVYKRISANIKYEQNTFKRKVESKIDVLNNKNKELEKEKRKLELEKEDIEKSKIRAWSRKSNYASEDFLFIEEEKIWMEMKVSHLLLHQGLNTRKVIT
ncbi:hypothetical protein N9948_00820 [bacterium]|nr:hypothetical protein [bacterium]